jgi:hydrogenase maturation protease
VLGIGNVLLSDEGAGVRVIEALRQFELPEGVELIDGGTGGADLVEFLADRQKVIVVGATDSDARPGTVQRLTVDQLLPAPGESVSLHQLDLLESLRIAEQLGCAPREVVVFGIQPARIVPGLELSPEVAAALPRAIALVQMELKGW